MGWKVDLGGIKGLLHCNYMSLSLSLYYINIPVSLANDYFYVHLIVVRFFLFPSHPSLSIIIMCGLFPRYPCDFLFSQMCILCSQLVAMADGCCCTEIFESVVLYLCSRKCRLLHLLYVPFYFAGKPMQRGSCLAPHSLYSCFEFSHTPLGQP